MFESKYVCTFELFSPIPALTGSQTAWPLAYRRPLRSDFLQDRLWLMWCTTFAFQPPHSAVEFKRYLARFAHMVGGFNRLQGIMRTVNNQFDSLVRPLRKWLDDRASCLRRIRR